MTPDVWLRSDYLHNIALGEVHLVRASAVQHDDDFVPLYDSETVECLRAERDALRAFARHVLSERISLSNESAAERYGLITWRWVDGYFIRSLTPLLTGGQT